MCLQAIKESLKATGFAILRKVSAGDVSEIISSVGDVIHTQDILHQALSTEMLFSTTSMPFHNDHPAASYIAWHCKSQAEAGGESLLVDLQCIIKSLPKKTVSLIKSINIYCPSLCSKKRYKIPMISPHGIYYAEWLIDKDITHEQHVALTEFKSIVDSTEKIVVKLGNNDLLIIDNRRLMHGRTPFVNGGTARHLVRYWITEKKEEGYGAIIRKMP
ncbi:MAG TPA: TauD/TfdA family dioxygenase [Cellvibrio sp.]|nr:TauD/TfdA family dioxygenase [Cellvibrio sp.]